MARVARKKNGKNPTPTGVKLDVAVDPKVIYVDVETSANSQMIVIWGLAPGEQMKVERFTNCPDEWKEHRVCGEPLILTAEKCDYILYLPGDYRISMVDDSDIPDAVMYEQFPVNATTVSLYFQEKGACCCAS